MPATSAPATSARAAVRAPSAPAAVAPTAPRTFEIDLRREPHSRRNPLVLERLAALDPQDRVIVVCEYEPRVLQLQLELWSPGVFAWRWLEPGPVTWRAEITRVARP